MKKQLKPTLDNLSDQVRNALNQLTDKRGLNSAPKQLVVLGSFPQTVLIIMTMSLMIAFAGFLVVGMIFGYSAFIAPDDFSSAKQIQQTKQMFYFCAGGTIIVAPQMFLISIMSTLTRNNDVVAAAFERWSMTQTTDLNEAGELVKAAAVMDPHPDSNQSSHNVEEAPARAVIPASPTTPVIDDTLYHYSGIAGNREPMNLKALAKIIINNDGDHHIWTEGWTDWKPATDVPELVDLIRSDNNPGAKT